MEQSRKLEDKILPILKYIGTIGAVLTAVAYIIVVIVLIKGFKVEEMMSITVFALVNAAVGFMIMQFLKIQGQSLALNLPDSQEVTKAYWNTKTKDKKLHSMTFYWITSVLKDIVVKCATLGASTVGMIYIVIEGNGDWQLMGLAIVNLILFVSFGLLSLNKAYEFTINNYIPYLKEKLKEAENGNN